MMSYKTAGTDKCAGGLRHESYFGAFFVRLRPKFILDQGPNAQIASRSKAYLRQIFYRLGIDATRLPRIRSIFY